MSVEVPVPSSGTYELQIVMTKAPDYAVVQLEVDDQTIDRAIDLFEAKNVVTTGVLTYPGIKLNQGTARLTLQIKGANPRATKSYMVAIDFVRLIPVQTP